MKTKAALTISLILCYWLVGDARPQTQALTETQKITHALNRIGFGPRPGDVERVKQVGISRYIDQQLHPELINDREADIRLSFFESVPMSISQVFDRYPDQQSLARQLGIQPKQAQGDDAKAMRQKIQEYSRNNGLQQPQKLLQELMGQKVVRAVYSERQLQEVMVDFWYNHFNIDFSKGQDKWLTTDFEMNAIRPNTLGKFKDLVMATAKSPAMMFYLDNHLSSAPNPQVAARQKAQAAGRKQGINENYARELMELHTLGVDGGYTQKDVQEVARALSGWTIMNQQPNAAQLATLAAENPQRALAANARQQAAGQMSPDNPTPQVSQAPGQARGQAQSAAAIRKAAQALTRKQEQAEKANSAKQAAQALRLQAAASVGRGEFLFRPALHDTGEKVVLGQTLIAGRGIEDGEQVIDILAHHPSTARFIATKLVRRFVSDNPPQKLVDRVAATFMKSDGDIREMLRVIFSSDEFFAPEAWQAKTKSPFELTASALRLLQGVTDGGQALTRLITDMGQPLYQYSPPTGFPDNMEQWINSGSVLERINFGIALTANRIPGTRVLLSAFNNDPKAAALYLGSPEFQKR